MAIIDPVQQQILAAQAAAKTAVPPTAVPPVVAQPGVVPLSSAMAGVAPLTIPATIQDPSAGLAKPDQNILGMTPEQFQAVMGGIGQALAPPDTWQSRLGAFAKQIGQGQIVGGLTGEDIKGTTLEPKIPTKAKKSVLDKPIDTKLDLSNTLLGR